jgi:hypothetical protein
VLLGEEPGGSRSQGRKNEGGGTRCWEEQISGGGGGSGAVCSGDVGEVAEPRMGGTGE